MHLLKIGTVDSQNKYYSSAYLPKGKPIPANKKELSWNWRDQRVQFLSMYLTNFSSFNFLKGHLPIPLVYVGRQEINLADEGEMHPNKSLLQGRSYHRAYFICLREDNMIISNQIPHVLWRAGAGHLVMLLQALAVDRKRSFMGIAIGFHSRARRDQARLSHSHKMRVWLIKAIPPLHEIKVRNKSQSSDSIINFM